jgi:hypothetical protein
MKRYGFSVSFQGFFSVFVFTSTLAISSLFSLSDTSAQEKQAKKYPSIYALKSDFVKAGAQCWEWERNKQFFEHLTADCDSKTKLIYYPKQTNTMTEALRMATTYREFKWKVNLLVGPNWIINSDQVRLVSKKLGGTLITR